MKASGKIPARYTKQAKLFQNWRDVDGTSCSVCGTPYIRVVKTMVSRIIVHRYSVLCVEPLGEKPLLSIAPTRLDR